MKAKEYANRILDTKTDQEFKFAVMDTMRDIREEFVKVSQSRNIKMADAVAAVILDFDRKWRNVIGLVNEKNPNYGRALLVDGFLKTIEASLRKISPQEWDIIEKRIRQRRAAK